MHTTEDIYKKIKALNEKGSLTGEITSTVYLEYFKCIKTQLESSDQKHRDHAIQTLQILIDHNVLTVRRDVLDIIEGGQVNPNLQESILENVSLQCLQQYLKEKNLAFVGKLYEISKKHNMDFLASLKAVLTLDVYRECGKDLIQNVLIPTIFNKKMLDSPENLVYLDVALVFAEALPYSLWTKKEIQTFVDDIPSKVNIISELREKNFNDWHKLWMFVVRFAGIKLHSSIQAINKLLRATETAFRNSSDTERMKGYDCWKELISNASLDLKYLTTAKQLKLVLTPLKAKFSNQETVVLKKFEVYAFLLEKLHHKAVLVLKDFLEFCFGQVSNSIDSNKIRFAKSVPELWLRLSKVFLAILGHSHNRDEDCLDSTTEINLKQAVVNSENIAEFAEHVVNSVAECCLCLKVVEVESKRRTVLKCLWRSLLNVILHSNEREVCYPFIGKVLNKFRQSDDSYSTTLSAIVFQEMVGNKSPNGASLVLNQLDALLFVVFSVPVNPECCVMVQELLAVLQSVDSAEVKATINSQVFNSFVNYKMVESNVNFVADIWIFVVNSTEEYVKAGSLDLLIWPIRYIHLITDKSKEVLIYEHYKRQLTPFVEKSDDLHLALFKQFEKILKNHPLLAANVFEVLATFQLKITHKNITNTTLDLLITMLLLIVTTNDSRQFGLRCIESYVKKLFENGLMEQQELPSIKKICTCVELLLRLNCYDVLIYFEQSFDSLPENVKLAYSKNLKLVTLTGILEAETDAEKKVNIQKMITALRNVKLSESKKNLMSIGGRSAKIANLVKQLPSSPPKPVKNQSPLRLFGKEIETHAPVKPVAGSQLKNKSTPKKSTPITKPVSASKAKPPFIDDESNSKFVVIDSEVKLDKTKLTEHQKEILAKRREDIPALYQDLSQSVSQSFDSSEAVTAKPDTTNQEPKVNQKELEAQKKKIETEMKKLSMNIVGAEQFLTPGTKRRRSVVSEEERKDKIKTPSQAPEEKASRPRRSKTPKRTSTENACCSTPTAKKPRSSSKSKKNTTANLKVLEKFLFGKQNEDLKHHVTGEDESETELFGSEAIPQDTSNKPEVKRKSHLSGTSGSEEDDIIESSQETTLPNDRWSINKSRRHSFPDPKLIDQSTKENSDNLNYVTVRRPRKDANPTKLGEEKLTPVVNLENINVVDNLAEDTKSLSKRRTDSVELRRSPRIQSDKPQQCIDPTKNISLTFSDSDSQLLQETPKDVTNCDLQMSETSITETQTEPTELFKTANQICQKSTQSQDTETIGTESLEMDQETVLPILDLPQKLPLTESEQEVAAMDTASFTSVHSSECTVIKKNETSSQETEEVAEVAIAQIRLTRCDEDQNVEGIENENELSKVKDLLVLNECKVVVEDVLSPGKRIPVDHCAATPDRLPASLPSSPVTVDTPNRTSELLTNTSDISPIASSQCSSDEEVSKKLVPVALNFDCDEDEPPEKAREVPTTPVDTSPENDNPEERVNASPPRDEEKSDIAERFKNALVWINPDSSYRSIAKHKCRSVLSPSASRIKKLMSKVKQESKTESLEEFREEDVLTFSREVPSPLAIPRSSILKRKHPDTHEDGIPCAKRKRVNFSDPCISSKKLFIREEAVQMPCGISDADIDQQLLEILTNQDQNVPNDSYITKNDNPIFPLLVDCKENVHDFLKWGFEDMTDNLGSKLDENNIKTVADLARLNETSIEKLSISIRGKLTLIGMLDSYHKKKCLDKTEINANKELDSQSPLDLAKRMLEKIDVKLELAQIVEKVKSQDIPLDTLFSVVLGSANQTEVLTWVKSHFRLQIADLLDEKDFRSVLKHITDSIGVHEVFKTLKEISSHDFNVAFDQCLQEKPLSEIVAKRNGQELSSVLLEESNSHIKQEIVDDFSRQATSAQLVPFFSQLNAPEMGDILLNRLSNENCVDFVKKITDSCENVKEAVLDQCTDSELIGKLLKRGSIESVMSELFDQLTTEKQKDMIVFLAKKI